MSESKCNKMSHNNPRMQNQSWQKLVNKIKYQINKEIALTILEFVQRRRQLNINIIRSIVFKWCRKAKLLMKIDLNICKLMEHAKMVYSEMVKTSDSIIIWYFPLAHLNISWRNVQNIKAIKKMKNECEKNLKICITYAVCAVIMDYILNIECMDDNCSNIIRMSDYRDVCNIGNVKRSALCSKCAESDKRDGCGYNHDIDEMSLGQSNRSNCDICYNNLCIPSCPSIQQCSCNNEICPTCAQKDYNVEKCGRCNINICYQCWILKEISDPSNGVNVIKICWDCLGTPEIKK